MMTDKVDQVRALMSSMKIPNPPERFADCSDEAWRKLVDGLQK
jgi:hypothetical protein